MFPSPVSSIIPKASLEAYISAVNTEKWFRSMLVRTSSPHTAAHPTSASFLNRSAYICLYPSYSVCTNSLNNVRCSFVVLLLLSSELTFGKSIDQVVFSMHCLAIRVRKRDCKHPSDTICLIAFCAPIDNDGVSCLFLYKRLGLRLWLRNARDFLIAPSFYKNTGRSHSLSLPIVHFTWAYAGWQG